MLPQLRIENEATATAFGHYLSAENMAELLYDRLSSSRYSRDSPTSPSMIVESFIERLIQDEPAEIVGLWGGSKEGGSQRPDSMDVLVLDNLATMREDANSIVSSDMPALSVNLLLCDVHHHVANNRAIRDVLDYTIAIGIQAKERKIETVCLSSFYTSHDFQPPSSDEFKQWIGSIRDRAIARDLLKANSILERNAIDAARKHSRWMNPVDDAHDADPLYRQIAKTYVQMEIDFLRRAQKTMPNAVFFSFSDPDIQRPIAEAAGVPMLYFHSISKTDHRCPWYVDERGERNSAPA